MSSTSLETGVDTAGFLAGLLTGYEPTAILREQAQNADDACHKAGIPGWLRIRFSPTNVVVENPSILSEDDWRRLAKTSSRGKAKDSEQTGEFGVGFWSVLHLTDAPTITSGMFSATIDQLSGKPATRVENPDRLEGTRFDLRLRTSETAASESLEVNPVTTELLDQLEQSFEHQIPQILLFAKSLERVELELRDGSTVVGQKTVSRTSGTVEKVTVSVDHEERPMNSTFLCLRDRCVDPPEGRSGEFAVAFPLSVDSNLAGRVFCTFPTETVTGMPFSINAHFYAAMDRRSIALDGSHGHWNDRLFAAAGRLIGRNLEDILDVDDGDLTSRLRWFIKREGEATEISRRRDLCLDEVDALAIGSALIRDRQGIRRKGEELVLLDMRADQLIGEHVLFSVERPTDPALVNLFLRWGVSEWRPCDVAYWVHENAPEEGVELSDAPAFMHTLDKLIQLLEYCDPVSAELGSACVALGTNNRLYPLGSKDLPKPVGRVGSLIGGLSSPTVQTALQGTIVWRRAHETTPEWLRLALLADAPALKGRMAQLPTVACFRSLNTVAEALELLVDAGQSLSGLPLAVDPDRKIQIFDETVLVGLPLGEHRAAAQKFLARLGYRTLHDKIDGQQLVGHGVGRVTASVLVDSVANANNWKPKRDTTGLIVTCAFLLGGRVVDRQDLTPLMKLEIWPTERGEMVALDGLHLPEQGRRIRENQKDRVLSSRLCDSNSPEGRAIRRILEDVFDRVTLDAAEECVALLENPPSDPDELYRAVDELSEHWRSLRPTQKDRLRAAPFVPCVDQMLRRPEDVLALRHPLPLGLGRKQLDGRLRDDRKLVEILVELGAHKTPTIDQLTDLAEEISQEEVQTENEPAHLLWKYLEFDHKRYATNGLSRIGRIAWLPSDPDNLRRRPADLAVPNLAYAQLLFPVATGVGTPNSSLRDGLGMRGTLEVGELITLGNIASEQGVRLDDEFFRVLETRAGNDGENEKISALRDARMLPVGGDLLAPSDLVSGTAGQLWEHLKTPVDQNFVRKFPRLCSLWGISDDEQPTWRDHMEVLRTLASLPELSARDAELAHRRMNSVAKALAAGDVTADELEGHRCVLTTNRKILRPEDTLRPDLPRSVVSRIKNHVPIADVTTRQTEDMLAQLPTESLREAIELEPEVEGSRKEDKWLTRLAVHQRSILRFLRYVRADLPDDWVENWPPVVETVRSLRLRAYHDSVLLAEWEDDCFISPRQGVLTLSIRGTRTDIRSIVDAIATLYGIEAGRKTLLVAVLQAETESEGREALDYDEIPDLRADDPWTNIEHAIVDVDLISAAAPSNEITTDVDSSVRDREESQSELGHEEPTLSQEPFVFEVDRPEEAHDTDEGDAHENVRLRPVSAEPDAHSELMVSDRPAPPRVHTDWEDLSQSYDVVDVWETDIEDVDLGDEEDETAHDSGHRSKCVLSFYDWGNGYLPIRSHDSRALAGPDGIRSVTIFGKELAATQVTDQAVQLEGGRDLYTQNEILPGTVIHLRPSLPGRIELHLNEDHHEVHDVWILEMDDDGRLHRERIDSVMVRWETDGPIYRSERRWEDLEALHAEAQSSALDLIIKVFKNFGDDGLTVDEIWSLVAVNRLFARSTISRQLYRQDELFSNEGDTWYLTGETVKRYRGRSGGAAAAGHASRTRGTKEEQVDDYALKLARKLRDLLRHGPQHLRQQVGQIIGLQVVALESEREFESAVEQYLDRPNERLLSAIRRDLADQPLLSNVAMTVVEGTSDFDTDAIEHILDLIDELGVAAAVARSLGFRCHVLPHATDDDGIDPVTGAENACASASHGQLTWRIAQQRMVDAYRAAGPDPYEDPREALDSLVRLERLERRHADRLDEAVLEERRLFIARLGAAVGDTDAHGDIGRQGLLASVRVLGDDREATLDVLTEYAKLLSRMTGDTGDGGAMFKLADSYARSARIGNHIARFVAERAKSAGGSSESVSPSIRDFIDRWCELAGIQVPK